MVLAPSDSARPQSTVHAAAKMAGMTGLEPGRKHFLLIAFHGFVSRGNFLPTVYGRIASGPASASDRLRPPPERRRPARGAGRRPGDRVRTPGARTHPGSGLR